jgi:hypothetical protein
VSSARGRRVARSRRVVAGGSPRRERPPDSVDFTAAAWSTNSFVDLAVYADHLDLRAIDQSGRIFDQASIEPADRAA